MRNAIQLSMQDVEETFEIRCALAADKAAGLIDAGALQRLRQLLASLSRPIRDAEGPQNPRTGQLQIPPHHCREMYQSLNAHLKIARIHASEESWRKRLDDGQAEYEQIVADLEKRDVNKDALVASVRSAG